MIFISTGTQLPFDRFIKILDEIARDIEEEIVVQAVPGQYEPSNFKLIPRVTVKQFNTYIDEARLVVAHAGMGTILTAMLKSKPIVVFPRKAALGEQRNDHQMATARRLEAMNYVHVAWEESDLHRLVKDKEAQSLHTVGAQASDELIAAIDDFINKRK